MAAALELSPSDARYITDRITNAIMEQRLPPGAKLAEERLAAAFKVSRTKIRQVLNGLAKHGLVDLFPNRGAYVASPSVQQSLDLFATRRLVEPEIIRNVIVRATTADLKRLRTHLAKEARARADADRRAIIKLSGEFHLLLAELAQNTFIAKLMSELCPLTCLIIALYDSPQAAACPQDEHSRIVDAIERRDAAAAVRLMLHHLEHVERALQLTADRKAEIDLDLLFG
jgi:DNA-binding GntR family transcriptional regulator